jgi:cell division protein FtsI (penicillin-binding protein 3)
VGSGYGAETSAPVFQVVAQQVLEYLGVPHDQPLKTPKELRATAAPEAMPDDDPGKNVADLSAMFDEINNLPVDDPLRVAATAGGVHADAMASAASAMATTQQAPAATRTSRVLNLLPAKVVAAFKEAGGSGPAMADTPVAAIRALNVAPREQSRGSSSVVVDAGQRVAVPSFVGDALRRVVETAAGLGLRVDPVGSGIAREQAPAAGTMVPMGTEVVVRFAR